jgi:hypothetical protein
MDDVRIYNRALAPMEIEALAIGQQPATGAVTYTLASPLTTNKDLTLNSGTLDVGPGTQPITVGGSWKNNGGRFARGSGTVTFNGALAGNVIQSGGQSFNNVTINGAGTWAALDPMNVEGTFSQSSGAFTAPSRQMELAGDVTLSGGTFTHNSGTTLLRPNGARTVTAAERPSTTSS